MEGRFVYGDDQYVPEEYMDEDWKLINGPGEYYVSTRSRIWSSSSKKFIKPKQLDNHGHLGICMSFKGKKHYKYWHRVMAEAFIPNPNNYPAVRHLDDDPTNNDLDNLAWGTQKDNMHDCMTNGHFYYFTKLDRRNGNIDRYCKVKATNIATNEEYIFESQNEAARQLNIHQANINKILKGERKTTGGYYFEKVED